MNEKQLKVKRELEQMGLVQDGLIAYGQTKMSGSFGGGLLGSLIANAVAEKYAIVKLNEKIMIVPFEETKIYYDKVVSYEKANIARAKISGDGFFIFRKLKIWTNDGKKHKYYITEGKKQVNEMLNQLGLNVKKEKE